MIAFIFSPLGKWIMIILMAALLIGSAVLYVKYTTNQLEAMAAKVALLDEQAKSLKAANDAMQTDIANVQSAQNDALNTLENIRVNSETLAEQIRNQHFDTTNPAALQLSINQSMAATLKALEALSKP